jgi:succinate-semialdehyde dehydrogenase/glutarate-semialdehyde dehydrogenase
MAELASTVELSNRSERFALRDRLLLQRDLFIDGAWAPSSSGQRSRVEDPCTGQLIAEVADASAQDVRDAVAAASRAFGDWSARPAKERAKILHRWYELTLENVDDLAAILTHEQGKPLAEARGELEYGAAFVEWFAEEAKRAYGEVIPSPARGKRMFVLRQPIGVCAAITPWNFPALMIQRKVAPALAVGCTMVLKPATETPLTALALAELAARAGLPAGVLNVVHGEPELVGAELMGSPAVRKVTFTGSTEVGRLLMAQAAATVKSVSLELGGNAPVLVFDDADLGAAVDGTIAAKFRNAGQTCVCANRILVQSGIYDDFVERLVHATRELRVGDGFDPDSQLGPLIDGRALSKVKAHVADAVAGGARLLCGGDTHALGGTFYEPTVLADARPGMLCATEETFGPVAPVFRFDDEASAVAMANDTESGLAAYLFSASSSRVWRVGEALEFGVVAVNTGSFSYEGAPFGGFKQSGTGREGGHQGLDEFLEVKYLCLETSTT